MKFFPKSFKKNEKGQVLVIVALTFTALVAIIGLAVDTGYLYVSYSRLRRGVDAAALAGTGEFKIPTGFTAPCAGACVTQRDANIYAATKQMLDLNGIVADPSSGFSDPMSGEVGISIQTCDNTPGDAVLCAAPLQKIIRVRVQEQVPLFFLAVVGWRSAPIIIESLATAASADVMLAIDTSDSMTYDYPDGSPMRDPNACNPHSCQPMEDVKAAARTFSDHLYYPYDRLGLITFDQYATVKLALSEDISEIHNEIEDITVFEGKTGTPLVGGGTQGGKCIYYLNDPALQAEFRDLQDPVPPHASPPNTADYAQDPYGPCRLYYYEGGPYWGMDCPMFYGTDPDPSHCGSTNIGGGIDLATRALLAQYPPSYPTPWPDIREDSIWVLVLLTDGAANAAYDSSGNVLCPRSTWTYKGFCRALNAADPIHDKTDPDYDAQDQARDMFITADKDNIVIYTIGMGDLVTDNPPDSTGPPPGETLLKYPESERGNGKYFFAPNGSSLDPVFLTIADLITSRINQ